MSMIRRYTACAAAWPVIAVLVLLACAVRADPDAEKPVFSHEIETEAKPWTHLRFDNNPDDFQFAIVSDRTGGHRAGIFPSAVPKLNTLRPEFVMCVGDLIEGYTENEAVLRKEWAEFKGFVRDFHMPFFYLPGNHDISNAKMADLYTELFGRRYYSFKYRNVLFICLNSQESIEGGAGLGAEQVRWAKDQIAKHDEVRWTLLFMHQPLWLYEQGNVQTARKDIGAPSKTGFGEVEEVLQGRPYTVFAGHFHQYIKCVRHSRNYYVLSTTGGGSQLRGPLFGEFDHAAWITMTDEGPKIANLLLDGILPDDVHTEDHVKFEQAQAFAVEDWARIGEGTKISFSMANPFSHEMFVTMDWPEEMGDWSVDPKSARFVVAPGKTNGVSFSLAYSGNDNYPIAPKCNATFNAGHEISVERALVARYDLDTFLRERVPTTTATYAKAAPRIDGKLGDPAWKRAAHIGEFMVPDLREKARVKTEAWITYDESALYVAMRNHEPRLSGMKHATTGRDGNIWADDTVEVFIDTNLDRKTYYQFAVNAAGTFFDAFVFDAKGYESSAESAVGREKGAWTFEIAIPWKDIGVEAPVDAAKMGFLLGRTRTQPKQLYQFPPVAGWCHRKENYGFLTFLPAGGR